jgi:short-subunit dehydrogenase
MQSKTILITGAGSGIGKASALALAKKGHRVIATTHTEAQAELLDKSAKDHGVDLRVFKLDVTNESDRKLILNYNLDVLINNAAIGESGSLAEIPVDKIRHNFEVNVFSAIELTQLALKGMMKKNSGTIIFIGSLAGRITMPFLAPYSMTKFALAGGIDALKQELKKVTGKVHVSLIEPGAYHTGFNQKNVAKKFEWMKEDSYFYGIKEKLRIYENFAFKLLEHKSLNGIVRKIVKATEAQKPALRYSAPFYQSAGTQLMRIFGK